VLSVCDAGKLLSETRARKPDYLAFLALGLFAGLRPEECIGPKGVSWNQIHLDRALLTVSPAASKIQRRRVVHLRPTAVAWLAEAHKRGSRLPLTAISKRRFVRWMRSVLGWDSWAPDILRHTAASHLLAALGDVGKVATELGNSPRILREHYLELVSEEESAKFWNLMP